MLNAFFYTTEILSVTDVSGSSYAPGRQEIEDLFKFIKKTTKKIF
jgi:hypothetical protein